MAKTPVDGVEKEDARLDEIIERLIRIEKKLDKHIDQSYGVHKGRRFTGVR